MSVRGAASLGFAEALRKDILSLRRKPGQVLDVAALCGEYGISRTPLRDGLLKLRDDHLVDVIPQSGTRVSLIDLSQVEVERFLRSSLEGRAASLFSQCATERALKEMEMLLEAQKEVLLSGDKSAFLGYDNDFHRVIFSSIGMGRLWDVIMRESGNYHRIRVLSFDDPRVGDDVIASHVEMIAAFRAHDRERAEELEERHVGKLTEERQGLLERFPHYFADERQKRL